jgi:hypothetical protein
MASRSRVDRRISRCVEKNTPVRNAAGADEQPHGWQNNQSGGGAQHERNAGQPGHNQHASATMPMAGTRNANGMKRKAHLAAGDQQARALLRRQSVHQRRARTVARACTESQHKVSGAESIHVVLTNSTAQDESQRTKRSILGNRLDRGATRLTGPQQEFPHNRRIEHDCRPAHVHVHPGVVLAARQKQTCINSSRRGSRWRKGEKNQWQD